MRLEIKTESRLHSAQTYGYRGKGVWGRHVHTDIFKADSQQGPTVEHRELCSTLCGSLDGGGGGAVCSVQRRMDAYICVTKPFCCALKLSQHC